MLIRWCKVLGVKTISLVRRQEQVDALTEIGGDYVFNTSEANWKNAVRAVTRELGTTIAFDAVAGDDTQDLFDVLIDESTVYTYGGLSGKPCSVSPGTLFSGDKTLKGLWLTRWLTKSPAEKKLEVANQVQDLIADVLKTDYSTEMTLDRIKEALHSYQEKKTDSKILIRPRVN